MNLKRAARLAEAVKPKSFEDIAAIFWAANARAERALDDAEQIVRDIKEMPR
jgi:hypothetical protein